MASTGSSSPTRRPTSRAQSPAALTTASALIVPCRRHHEPAAVRLGLELDDRGLAVDLGAREARRPGIGVGHPGRIDVALVRIEQGARELPGLDQRMAPPRLLDRDELAVQAEHLAPGVRGPEKVEALGRAGEHDPAGQVDAAGLPRDVLELAVQADGVVLELGDVGVAVERVHAARRMPAGAGGQLVALEQHDVPPAELGQVVEHAAPDHAATDHRDPNVRFHPRSPPLRPGRRPL